MSKYSEKMLRNRSPSYEAVTVAHSRDWTSIDQPVFPPKDRTDTTTDRSDP